MEGKETQTLTDDYCWYEALERAIAKNRRDTHNRYLQLATVRTDGTPAVRSLVFRTLEQGPARLVMVTDRRSQKPAEIAAHSAGEICWYFSRTREQFRLHGTLLLTGEEDVDQGQRSTIWQAMSSAAREQFFWPHPKRPVNADVSSRDNDERGIAATSDTHCPPANFLLLSLHIKSVDHLRLRGKPQSRWLSSLDTEGCWSSELVNP